MTIKHILSPEKKHIENPKTYLHPDEAIKKHLNVEENEEKYVKELEKVIPHNIKIENLRHFSSFGGKKIALRFDFTSTGLTSRDFEKLLKGKNLVLKALSEDKFMCDAEIDPIEL